VLAPGGVLACTLFGYHTCDELFESLDGAKMGEFKFNRLPDLPEVRRSLEESGLTQITVNVERIRIQFKDMYGLMAWLKSIGANNLSREGYVGCHGLLRAAAIYKERFASKDGVFATFEVIWVYAKR